MNETIREIRLYAMEKKTNDGKSFVTWSYTKNGEKFYEVHFTKGCAIPQKRGYYLAKVNVADVNIKKSKPRSFMDDNGVVTTIQPNDKMWIKKVISIVSDEEYEKEIETKRLNEVMDVL